MNIMAQLRNRSRAGPTLCGEASKLRVANGEVADQTNGIILDRIGKGLEGRQVVFRSTGVNRRIWPTYSCPAYSGPATDFAGAMHEFIAV